VRGVSFGPCIWSGPVGVLNQHIYRIVPNSGVNKRWLYETLRAITQKIEKRAHGFKIELVHARKADITGQAITVPPSREQDAIAKYAESLELGLTADSNQVQALSKLREGILNTLF
jgi:type I restriction enzyme S subunit